MSSADGAHAGDTTVAGPKSTTSDLVRALGQLDSTMIVLGILIGSGIFIVSAESARLMGATGWLLIVWALAVAFATFSGVLIPWISVDHFILEPIVLGWYAVIVSTQRLVAILGVVTLTHDLRPAAQFVEFPAAPGRNPLGLVRRFFVNLTMPTNARPDATLPGLDRVLGHYEVRRVFMVGVSGNLVRERDGDLSGFMDE